MCIEAAITQSCGLPFGDDPVCVEPDVRSFKIRLNDSRRWVNDASRAAGMFDLGIAQLGSRGLVDPRAFRNQMQEQTNRQLIPALFREIFTANTATHKRCRAAADRCENEGTTEASLGARYAASDAAYNAYAATAAYAAAANANAAYAATYAADAATYAANAATYAANANATDANAAAYAAAAAASAVGEKYLILSASICLRVLRELGSPGCAVLDQIKASQ
jgi:hypothetical protein